MQLRILLLLLLASFGTTIAQNSCESSCGNVSIVFPFGSGEGCYHTSDFLVTCNRSSGQPIPFYRNSSTNIVITNMSTSESEMEIMMFVAHDCYNSSSRVRRTNPSLKLTDFRISTKNRFVAIGCDTDAIISGVRGTKYADRTGCISYCGSNMSSIVNGSCSGVGCCEVAIPQGMNSFQIRLRSRMNHSKIADFNPCSYGFVVQQGNFNFSTNNLHDFGSVDKMPMLLDWAIGNETCQVARKNTSAFLCKGNTSQCVEEYGGPGYRCRCRPGYAGNPYIEDNWHNLESIKTSCSKSTTIL